MPNYEAPSQELSYDPEDLLLLDRDPAIDEQIGGAALYGEVTIDPIDLEEDFRMFDALANGDDVRPEDRGRIYNLEAAHEAALPENEMFDIHTEALRENKLFDAHVEALQEDKARTQRLREERENPDDDKLKATSETHQPSVRKQAEMALSNAGYLEVIPFGAQIYKDSASGDIIITNNNDIKVLEPQPGGKTRVTEYNFNESENTLTISARGANTITAHVGDFVPGNVKEGRQRFESRAISLPPAVARAVGFSKAVPVLPKVDEMTFL